MSENALSDRSGVFEVITPDAGIATSPLVFDSPHSGTLFPSDFHPLCSEADIRAGEDTLVDQLLINAPACGAPVLKAAFTRSYIDLNRALEDIDPVLCDGTLPWPVHPTKRTHYGLGLIHNRARGEAIYDGPLPAADIVHRVEHYYNPYHACLAKLVQNAHTQHGHVLHLNIHAMPSRTIEGKQLPDIVIGDLDGAASHRLWRDTVRDLFKQAGFVVSINTPYKGVEIINRTGKPRFGVHALQIEINKALYLDEQTLQPHDGFSDCQQVMTSIWQTLTGILQDFTHRHAAE